MLTCRTGLVSLVVVLACGAIAFGQAKATEKPKPKDESVEGVYKFAGAKEGTFFGRQVKIVIASPATGGNANEFIIPNKDPEAKKLDPNESMNDVVTGAKNGTYIQLSAEKFKGKWMLGKLSAYELKPGEDEAGVYVYVGKDSKTVNKEEFTTVKATKFGQETVFTIPNKPNGEKKMAPSEDILKQVDALKEGDSVEIQADKVGQNVMLKTATAYVLPKPMTFTKKFREKVGEVEMNGIEVKDGDTAVKIMVNPKGKDVAGLMTKVLTFKDGDAVMVRSTTDDKGNWLLDIKAGPKEDKPKDKDKPTDKPTDKPAEKAKPELKLD